MILYEQEMIKIEKINGILLLIGAEDDVLWDPAKYIRRMKQRMKEHPHTCRVEYVLAFQAARKHPKECRSTRLDIDQRVRNAVAEWKSRKRDG